MHWTLLDSRSRLQEAASWVAAIASALLHCVIYGWKLRFSFWESMTSFTFYFCLFSLLFMVFVSSQFLHHPPIFASLLCFLSSFVHLRFCAHTYEHMVWRGNWHSSVRVCLSWRIYRLLFSLYLKLFCTHLHVQAPLVQMLGNSNRMEQCTMDAALGARGTLLWPRAHSTLLWLFAVHVTQARVPWIASHVKFFSRDSKIYCGLDQSPTVPGCRNNQTSHPAKVFLLTCWLLLIKYLLPLFKSTSVEFRDSFFPQLLSLLVPIILLFYI